VVRCSIAGRSRVIRRGDIARDITERKRWWAGGSQFDMVGTSGSPARISAASAHMGKRGSWASTAEKVAGSPRIRAMSS